VDAKINEQIGILSQFCLDALAECDDERFEHSATSTTARRVIGRCGRKGIGSDGEGSERSR
jgi:hypothetical protein